MTPIRDLVRVLLAFPGSDLVELDADDVAGHALAYGCAGYEVLPLKGKVPAIPSAHPLGDSLRGTCKGGCGRDGHGVFDATTDLVRIANWWERYAMANIGCRVPEGVIVVDLDPRHGALEHLDRLEAAHGPIRTRTAWSGRGDGGRHFWFRHPGGQISSSRLPRGWDLKTHGGYVVLPPSIHPDSGQPYRWELS